MYRNVLVAIHALVAAMEELQISYASEAAREAAEQLESLSVDALQTINDDMKRTVACVWKDGGVQRCYQRRREYQISDSAK